MNAERLHAIAIVLYQEITKGKLVQRFQDVINSLQNVVVNPRQPINRISPILLKHFTLLLKTRRATHSVPLGGKYFWKSVVMICMEVI